MADLKGKRIGKAIPLTQTLAGDEAHSPEDDSGKRVNASHRARRGIVGFSSSRESVVGHDDDRPVRSLSSSGFADWAMSSHSADGLALSFGTSPNARKFNKGRPPWYDSRGSIREPVVVGVAGGSGSGKKRVCKEIVNALQVQWAVLLGMDQFYHDVNATHDGPGLYSTSKQDGDRVDEEEDEREMYDEKDECGLARHISGSSNEEEDKDTPSVFDHNFDHPSAIDWPLLRETLRALKKGRNVTVPEYNTTTLKRSDHGRKIYGADVILVEGTFALYDQQLRSLMDICVFIETDSDVRLARRLRRDHHELGRDMYKILEQYQKYVKPGYDEFVAPSRQYADVIIPRGIDNKVALRILSRHLKGMLVERGYRAIDIDVREPGWSKPPPNVHLLPESPQVLALHTIIRDVKTNREDFVFYSNRLARLVVEHALTLLPVTPSQVTTPTGATYKGVAFASRPVAVSVVRAGEAMEEAVRDVLDLPIGKLLIQSKKKKPRLFYVKLPENLANKSVLLLDATLATGAAAKMAVRVLLDHGVREDHIYFLALIASPQSLQSILYAYPKVNIIVSQVDQGLNQDKYLMPGVGNFGNRYYGTEK